MENGQFMQKLLEFRQHNMIEGVEIPKHKLHMFEGTPKKHPVDPNLLVLLVNPYERNKKYYEFKMDTIADIEEIETISSEDGENASRVRIWVYKGTVAFKTEPFIV
ncbi:MAG: inorganic pyrophosphatase Ppa [Spirochaetota bacterium]